MSDATTNCLTEVAKVLEAHGLSKKKTSQYVVFFSCDPRPLRACAPEDVGILVATLEGCCDTFPEVSNTAASVAAWAFCQIGSTQALTPAEFMNSVQILLADVSSDHKGILLSREPIEGLAVGFILMAAALEVCGTDSVLSRAFEGIGDTLDAVAARADDDYDSTYEGTAVVETVIVDWLINHAQEALDYAAALKSLPGLNVKVRSGLEDALESLVPALETFTEDAG